MHANKQPNPYLTPGRKPVMELLATQPEIIDTIFLAEDTPGLGEIQKICREQNARFRKIPRHELDRMFAGNHQGVIARVRGRRFVDLDRLIEQASSAEFPVILALDQVQDPGNVGTLARTLHALGGVGLLFPQDRTAFLGQAAAKAAAGALDRLSLCQVVNLSRALDACAMAGLAIYGSDAGPNSQPLFKASLRLPAVLVLGNEDKGMRPNVGKRCDATLKIPIREDFDSLNVAQAGAMILTEMLRQSQG
ncbi:MAG: 23S rRNA (guanosine(2251)-2'-O)-methyltransferase RlmB [Deltaproteobacteria bacterium]|nr:23S rRNA (guanosine(2251)-2'-O)-methyltransferase RlmB [Deltaproteobacteria bacterium]